MSFEPTKFSASDRVRLVHTNDSYTQLRPGDEGTVRSVFHTQNVHTVNIKWDSGSSLSMLLDEGDVIEHV